MDRKFRGVVMKNKDGSIVPEDQWIVFLVKDNAFPAALQAYLEKCIELDAATEQVRSVKDLRERVAFWRLEHPDLCKVPDVDPGELRP